MDAFFNRCRVMFTNSPHEVSFTDPQAWQDIYERHEKEPEFTRNSQSWVSSLPKTPSIFNTDGEDHEFFRRYISEVLSEPALQSYEPLIQSYLETLVWAITERTSKLSPTRHAFLRMDSWLSFATHDIMHHLCLGERSYCLVNGRHQSWLDLRFQNPQWALVEMTKRVAPGHFPQKSGSPVAPLVGRQSDYIKWIENVTNSFEMRSEPWGESRPSAALKAQAKKTFQALHNSFHRSWSRCEDLKYPFFLTRLAQCPFKDTNTVARLEATFFAMQIKGSEATATVLSGILHYLIKQYSDSYYNARDFTPFRMLANEIRTTFESSSPISDDKLRELPYLNAVIKEGLRLCPPFPTTFTRYVPAGGAVVCEQHLAANTPVTINRFQMCRSASNFYDPESFKPERWLHGSEEIDSWTDALIHNEDAFHPFGLGSGKCPGSDIAYMMMRLILAKIFWHFNLQKSEPLLPWVDRKSGVFNERKRWGVYLQLRVEEERK